MAVDNQNLQMQLGVGGQFGANQYADKWLGESGYDGVEYAPQQNRRTIFPISSEGINPEPSFAPQQRAFGGLNLASRQQQSSGPVDDQGRPQGRLSQSIFYGADNAPAWQRYQQSVDPSLQFLFDSKVANKAAGAGNVDALSGELTRLWQNGLKFGNKSGHSEEQIARMAPDLARYDVQSLSEIKPYSMPDPTGRNETVDVFYNTRTGQVIPTKFGSSMKGEGGSGYRLVNVNGQAVPVPVWKDTSDKQDILNVISTLGFVLGPALAPAMAASTAGAAQSLAASTGMSQAAAQAAVNAGLQGTVQGGLTSLAGGDFSKGFLSGAAGSGVGSLAKWANVGGQLASNPTVANAINSAVTGGAKAGVNAAINGGDPGSAITGGALSSGLASGLGSVGTSMGLSPGISSQLGGMGSQWLLGGLNSTRKKPHG